MILIFLICLGSFSYCAVASTTLDKKYRLETLGILKSWDNLDGVFSESVANAFNQYFAHQNRFIQNDLTKTDNLFFNSKISYQKIIQDNQILGQLAIISHSDSLIRTKLIKHGKKYFISLDWLRLDRADSKEKFEMELLATLEFHLEESGPDEPIEPDLISKGIQQNLPKLLSQLPFMATVTGRDSNTVTLNIGSSSGLKKGDILRIGTLEEVRVHPVLRKIVNWRTVSTGKVLVEQIEESITFCKILEEENGKAISYLQKVLTVEELISPKEVSGKEEVKVTDLKIKNIEENKPTFGRIGIQITPGSYTRQFSLPSSGLSNTGGGLSLTAKVSGEAWLTREWFSHLEIGYSFFNFSQSSLDSGLKTPASNNGGVAASISSIKADLGYTYLLTREILGPKTWFKLGYKSHNESFPNQTLPEMTGPVLYKSFFLGTGGNVPLLENWGALADFNFRIATSVNATWLAEEVSGTYDVELIFGGYYRLNSRVYLRITLEIASTGASFSGGSTLDQKIITFGPTLLYYF